jgi:2-iminobutanoate/2-iminopropanoate deaminase
VIPFRTLIACLAVTCICAALPPAAAAEPARRYVGTQPDDKRPFSPGVVVGNTLYLAGTLGLDAKTGQPPADVKAEIKNALDSLQKTAEAAGYKMDDLVSVQVFCTDLTLFDTFNEVYRTYFHGHFPARAFLGTDKLLRNAHFEIMGIAVKG